MSNVGKHTVKRLKEYFDNIKATKSTKAPNMHNSDNPVVDPNLFEANKEKCRQCWDKIKDFLSLANIDENNDNIILDISTDLDACILDRSAAEVDKQLAVLETEVKMFIRYEISKNADKEVEKIDKRRRGILIAICVVIIGFALAAVALMIAQFVDSNEEHQELYLQLSGYFGTFDFILGAIAFVSERLSDLRRAKIIRAASKVENSDNDDIVKDGMKDLGVLINNGIYNDTKSLCNININK